MTAARDIVYVGPTLPAAEVGALLPGADVRGPVAVGDVLRVVDARARLAPAARVRRIAIIDGYFERMAALWHKEILIALEAGIEVWGAASMGALRAAELAPFGMRGVGRVFERFASGELDADDEVAVAHLPADYAYRSTSVALVDLREGIAEVVARRRLSAKMHAQLVALARAPFYRERTWARLVADARAAGIARTTVAALAAIGEAAPSRKALDARLLLETMARAKRAPRRRVAVPRTWAIAQLRAALAPKPRAKARR